MSDDDVLILKSEGANKIQNFCYDTAKKLGLELENVYWSSDIIEPPESERYILNVEAKNGAITEIRFSRAEIKAYPMPHGTEKTNKKIKMELEGLL